MMQKPKAFIPGLNGLRFLAFLLIFIHHSSTQHIPVLLYVKKFGWLGVEIFFCMSAFLLTRLLRYEILQMGDVDIYKFLMRRILRIWPLYFSYVILAIIYSSYKHVIIVDNWHRAVGLLTFSDDFFAAWEGFNPILFTGHLWTISYEEQFYLLLPFFVPWLFRTTPKKRIYFLLTIFIVSSIVRCIVIYLDVRDPFLWTFPVTHVESILLGVAIAFYEGEVRDASRRVVTVIFFISALCIFVLPDINVISYHLAIVYPMIGLCSASVLCFVIHDRAVVVKQILSNNVIEFAGKISFGLYVFHILCMNVVETLVGVLSPMLNLVLSLSLVIIVSSLSYLLFEKRFLLMKMRFTRIPSLDE